MATIRAYTTIEQSCKLAEVLPLESADMYYNLAESKTPNFIVGSNADYKCYILCWSLASLLGVLPIIDLCAASLKMKLNHKYYMEFFINKRYVTTEDYDNPVDACYEMIIRLHELKML